MNWLLKKLGLLTQQQTLALCESAAYGLLKTEFNYVYADGIKFAILPEDFAKLELVNGQLVDLIWLSNALVASKNYYQAEIEADKTEPRKTFFT